MSQAAEVTKRPPPAGLPRFGPTVFVEGLEATIAQKRWLVIESTPAKAWSNMATEVLVQGPFDLGAFREAATMLVERHTALRTVFMPRGGLSYGQKILDSDITLTEIDLTGASDPAAAQESVWAALRDLRGYPTDLTSDLMMRFAAIRLSPVHTIVSVVVHHIAIDDVSWKQLMPELWFLYDACLARRQVKLTPTLQYYDNANWELALRAAQGSVWDEARPFDAIDLPPDNPKVPGKAYPRSAIAVHVDPSQTARMRAMLRKAGMTVPAFILHAFGTIFAEWSGKSQFTLPYLVYGRPVGAEKVVGQFVQIRPFQWQALQGGDLIGALQGARAAYAQSAAARNVLPTQVGVDIKVERLIFNLIKGNTLYSGGVKAAPPTQDADASASTPAPRAAPAFKLTPYRPVRPLRTTIRPEMYVTLHETPETIAGNIAFGNELYSVEKVSWAIDRFGELIDAHCDAAGV